jgi:hypothetical protein
MRGCKGILERGSDLLRAAAEFNESFATRKRRFFRAKSISFRVAFMFLLGEAPGREEAGAWGNTRVWFIDPGAQQ